MEPQGLGCGVTRRDRLIGNIIRCFNGATGFRLWSPFEVSGFPFVVAPSFNGATGFRLWSQQIKEERGKRYGASMEPQGLGCGVRVCYLQGRAPIAAASMEPQGLGCGVGFTSSDFTSISNRCFNGATGFRLWSLSPGIGFH